MSDSRSAYTRNEAKNKLNKHNSQTFKESTEKHWRSPEDHGMKRQWCSFIMTTVGIQQPGSRRNEGLRVERRVYTRLKALQWIQWTEGSNPPALLSDKTVQVVLVLLIKAAGQWDDLGQVGALRTTEHQIPDPRWWPRNMSLIMCSGASQDVSTFQTTEYYNFKCFTFCSSWLGCSFSLWTAQCLALRRCWVWYPSVAFLCGVCPLHAVLA